MPSILLASTNAGKIREFRSLLSGLGYPLVTLAEQGISKVVAETGSSYEENARIKATTYAELGHLITLADDSGLEVDALGGEPGAYSARFAGEDATDADRIRDLLARLDDIPWEKRTACFKCVIALATAEGRLELCRGECQGMIAFKARGESGFGYDPIFYLPEIGKAMSELPLEVKNEISHRAQASQKVHEALKRLCS